MVLFYNGSTTIRLYDLHLITHTHIQNWNLYISRIHRVRNPAFWWEVRIIEILFVILFEILLAVSSVSFFEKLVESVTKLLKILNELAQFQKFLGVQ